MGKTEKWRGYKMFFGFCWSWFLIIALAGYYFIASAVVEITLQWRYCALIIAITALLSFLFVAWFKRWESKESNEVK